MFLVKFVVQIKSHEYRGLVVKSFDDLDDAEQDAKERNERKNDFRKKISEIFEDSEIEKGKFEVFCEPPYYYDRCECGDPFDSEDEFDFYFIGDVNGPEGCGSSKCVKILHPNSNSFDS